MEVRFASEGFEFASEGFEFVDISKSIKFVDLEKVLEILVVEFFCLMYVLWFENLFVKEDHKMKIDEGCLGFWFEICIIMGMGMIFKS